MRAGSDTKWLLDFRFQVGEAGRLTFTPRVLMGAWWAGGRGTLWPRVLMGSRWAGGGELSTPQVLMGAWWAGGRGTLRPGVLMGAWWAGGFLESLRAGLCCFGVLCGL